MGTSPSRARTGTAAPVAVYFAALVAGLSVVSFAASGTTLKAALHLGDSKYGAIFLPQVAFTIAGSLAGGALAARVAPKALLQIALAAFAAAEGALHATSMADPSKGYALLLAATSFVGAGFGLAAGPLNTLPARLFPAHPETALVALHTAIGTGFALGPVVVDRIATAWSWNVAPLVLFACASACAVLVSLAGVPAPPSAGVRRDGAALPVGKLAPHLAIAVLYAFAEGTFANWGTVFLKEERGIAGESAALALACFWAGLAAGRLLVSALLVRISADRIGRALPVAMAGAALLVPEAATPATGVAVFALAGLACSAFFPLTVSRAVAVDPRRGDAIASAMTAALMLGVGLGSFTVGPLREALSVAQIYRLSALYPCAALAIAVLTARSGRGKVRQPAETTAQLPRSAR